MSCTDDLEWLNNKLDQDSLSIHHVCIKFNTVWVLCLEVELCPATGNSHKVVIKLWLFE